MIDCSRTEKFFAEKRRMVKADKTGACRIKCEECPLGSCNNGTNCKICCTELERCYSEKAVKIVQRWSDQHPQKTYLTELLKSFPSTPLGDDGTPEIICPHHLGLKDIKDCEIDANCVECWNRIIEDGEE